MEKCPACRKGDLKPAQMNCPECGTIFKNCPDCRTKLPQDVSTCNQCGAVFGGNKKGSSGEKSWIKEHPVAFAFLILFGLVVLGNIVKDEKREGGGKEESPSRELKKSFDNLFGKNEKKENNTAEEKKEKIFSMGEEVELKEFIYKVLRVEEQEIIGNDTFNRKADGIYKILHFRIKNIGDTPRLLNNSFFTLQDEEKRSFSTSSEGSAAYILSGGKNELFLKNLNPGVETEGVLIYDIPKNLRGLKLVVYGGFLGWKKAYISLSSY